MALFLFSFKRFLLYIEFVQEDSFVLNKALKLSHPTNFQMALANGFSHRDLLTIISDHNEEGILLFGYYPFVK